MNEWDIVNQERKGIESLVNYATRHYVTKDDVLAEFIKAGLKFSDEHEAEYKVNKDKFLIQKMLNQYNHTLNYIDEQVGNKYYDKREE